MCLRSAAADERSLQFGHQIRDLQRLDCGCLRSGKHGGVFEEIFDSLRKFGSINSQPLENTHGFRAELAGPILG